MDDEELDFLEAAVGSWMQPHERDAHHDITAYVAAKTSTQRKPLLAATTAAAGGRYRQLPPLQNTRPTVAAPRYKSAKLYGYHEPTSMMRGGTVARARLAEEAARAAGRVAAGEWSAAPSTGIPHYDPARDKHLRRMKRGAGKPLAGRDNAKPSTTSGSCAQQTTRAAGAGSSGGATAGAAPMHHQQQERQQLPPLQRVARTAEPRRPPQQLPSEITVGRSRSGGGRRNAGPAHCRTSSGVAMRRFQPASDARVAGPGHHSRRRPPATAPTRTAAVASDREAPLVTQEHFLARLGVVRRDTALLMDQLVAERDAKAQAAARVANAKGAVEALHEAMEATKASMKALERTAQRCSRQEAERSRWAHKVHHKANQVRDLRRMLEVTRARVDALSAEHDAGAASAAGGGGSSPRGPVNTAGTTLSGGGGGARAVSKDAIRALAKRSSQLQKKHERLVAQKSELRRQLKEALQSIQSQQDAWRVAEDSAQREQAAVVKEEEARLRQELQATVQRLRENQTRVLRHREREHAEQVRQRREEIDDAKRQLAALVDASSAGSGGKTHSGKNAEAEQQTSEQKKAASEAQARHDAARVEVDALLQRQRALEVDIVAEREALQRLEAERARAEEEPQKMLAPIKQGHDAQRTKLLAESAALQKRQSERLQSVAKVEAELQLAHARYPADGAAALQKELDELQAEIGRLNGEIDAYNVALASARKDLADAKKALIADERKNVVIEQRTQALSAAEAELKKLERRNTELLERLDLAERMIAMNGLK